MELLKKAKAEAAYAKLGFYGEAGAGKTYTASLVAIGLARFIKSKKPIAFASTEPGVDYVQHLFEEAKIDLVVAKTRAFSDLLNIADEAEKECSVFLIDSITHYWTELQEAYMAKNGLKKISWIKHSAPIKAMWRDLTDRYINGKIHTIVIGRSTVIFEDVVEEDGSKETKKVGTKMKTENEMSYEPSLLIEMSIAQASPQFGSKQIRRAFVKKDRFDVMDGAKIDNPRFESFLPHIERLNLGGEHRALDTSRNSRALIESDDNGEKRMIRKEILLEKVTSEIKKLYPSQGEEDKVARIKLMEEVFNTNSWKEISTFLKNDMLDAGLNILIEKNNPAPAQEKSKKKGAK